MDEADIQYEAIFYTASMLLPCFLRYGSESRCPDNREYMEARGLDICETEGQSFVRL